MPELRKDPITSRWVIVSTERGKRPYDVRECPHKWEENIHCPFCAGNESMTPPEITALRDKGTKPNTPGWQVRVVPNKFPALGIDQDLKKRGTGMYDKMTGFGAHEVVIETPNHRQVFHELPTDHIKNILAVCQDRIEDLHKDIRFRYVLLFRNDGPQAGASLQHPHSQLIATPITPKRVKEELMGAEAYYKVKERCVFCDIIQQELDAKERIIYENAHFVAFCPYWSRFPFEIWMLPKRHELDFYSSREHLPEMAQALKVSIQKLGVVLNQPDYNFIVHTAPNLFSRRGYWQTIHEDYHWHFEIIPRLTKVAGFEWGTGFYINPTPPEEAASYLSQAIIPA